MSSTDVSDKVKPWCFSTWSAKEKGQRWGCVNLGLWNRRPAVPGGWETACISAKHFLFCCCLFLHPFYFIIFSFIFISWRLITLQYCSGFCHSLTWISHGFTCAPHPEPPSHLHPHLIPSLWVIPVHQPWALVSCIQPGLVLCFTLIIYMFQCYSLRSSIQRKLSSSKKGHQSFE